MMAKGKNPFFATKYRDRPDSQTYICPHGVKRTINLNICEQCDAAEFAIIPNEMRLVEASTGRLISVMRVPKGMRKPPRKGNRMAATRPTLRPAFTRADERPRLHLRLVERDGQPAIAYRSHPAAVERYAASIELAMGELLGDEIGKPAVIMWDGLTAPPRADPEGE